MWNIVIQKKINVLNTYTFELIGIFANIWRIIEVTIKKNMKEIKYTHLNFPLSILAFALISPGIAWKKTALSKVASIKQFITNNVNFIRYFKNYSLKTPPWRRLVLTFCVPLFLFSSAAAIISLHCANCKQRLPHVCRRAYNVFTRLFGFSRIVTWACRGCYV